MKRLAILTLCLAGCGELSDPKQFPIPAESRDAEIVAALEKIEAKLSTDNHSEVASILRDIESKLSQPVKAEAQSPLPVTVVQIHPAPFACPPCDAAKAEVAALPPGEQLRSGVVYVVVPPAQAPPWVKDKAEKYGYPLLEWTAPDGKWEYEKGWPGHTVIVEKIRKHRKTTTRVRVHGPVMYGSVTSQWTWPGDLRQHLVNTHGLSPERVARMSDAELARWHDRDHNSGGPKSRVTVRSHGIVGGAAVGSGRLLFGNQFGKQRVKVKARRRACPTC